MRFVYLLILTFFRNCFKKNVDPLEVLVETDLHPLEFLSGLLILKLTFFFLNCKISPKAFLSEIALTYEKARLHGARCASLSNLELDQKHLTKEKTALLAVVSSRVCMNIEITGHFFVCRRFENCHLPKSSRYTTKRCPFSILLCYHKYQNMSKKMTVLVKPSISNHFCTWQDPSDSAGQSFWCAMLYTKEPGRKVKHRNHAPVHRHKVHTIGFPSLGEKS